MSAFLKKLREYALKAQEEENARVIRAFIECYRYQQEFIRRYGYGVKRIPRAKL